MPDEPLAVPPSGGTAPDEAPRPDAPVASEPRAPRRGQRALTGLRVLAMGLVAAAVLRACVFEAYRIPSPSMEDTLLVGDLVFVSKLHVGARLGEHRLPALRPPRRGDVLVFHFPPGREARVGARAPYVKRVAALPADTVRLVAKRLVVGRDTVQLPPEARQAWTVATRRGQPPAEALVRAGLGGPADRLAPGVWLFHATAAEAGRLRAQPDVRAVAPYVRQPGDGSATFPPSRRWSLDDYGPLVVPRAGWTVPLTDSTWGLYRATIERHEGLRTERTAEGFTIGGHPADRYTFAQDYYFVLGDHRDDSSDSRTWGFVPASHLIGTAVLVYGSWDAGARRVRWSRIGRRVR